MRTLYDNYILMQADIMSILLFYITVISLIIIVLINSTYIRRYIKNIVYKKMINETIWSEIIFEGQYDDKSLHNSNSLVNEILTILPLHYNKKMGIFNTKSFIGLVLQLNPEDNNLHLYIGVDSDTYNPETLTSWAEKQNCSIEQVDYEDILQVDGAITTVKTKKYQLSQLKEQVTNSDIGRVITNLQSTRTPTTILITIKQMSNSETINIKNSIINYDDNDKNNNLKTMNEEMRFDNTLGNLPLRAEINTISTTKQKAKSITEKLLRSISGLGVKYTVTDYIRQSHYKVLYSLPFIGLLFLNYHYNKTLWVLIAGIILPLFSLLIAPLMSEYWIKQSIKNNSHVVENYHKNYIKEYVFNKISPRFNFIDKNIIPFYQNTVMQLFSIPQVETETINMSKSVIPQIALSNKVNTNKELKELVNNNKALYVGMSVKNFEPVYRTLNDINYGISIGGDSGTGKSNALMNDYLGVCQIKENNKDAYINPIWFETKSDNFSKLVKNIKRYSPLVLSLHDNTKKVRLALEGKRLKDTNTTIEDIEFNRNNLISVFEALWGDAFGAQSKSVAQTALTISYLINKQELESLGIVSRIKNPDRPNIIKLTYLLIGGDPSIRIVEGLERLADSKRNILYNPVLFNEFKAQNTILEVQRLEYLLTAIDGLINLYDNKDSVRPLRNKLEQLMLSDGLWETMTQNNTERKEISIRDLYSHNKAVLLDMTSNGSSLSEDNSRLFVMMVHYLLWHSIRTQAGGWAEKEKYIPLYADEITNFTGDNNDNSKCNKIISEVREQGRSFGVSHNVGYQNFSQLSPEVKNSVLSFKSKIFFSMESNSDQEQVIEQLHNDKYTKNNIKYLPVGVGIAQLSINNIKVNPFTIKTPLETDLLNSMSNYNDLNDIVNDMYDEEKEFLKTHRYH